jgi:hypothetical protein
MYLYIAFQPLKTTLQKYLYTSRLFLSLRVHITYHNTVYLYIAFQPLDSTPQKYLYTPRLYPSLGAYITFRNIFKQVDNAARASTLLLNLSIQHYKSTCIPPGSNLSHLSANVK